MAEHPHIWICNTCGACRPRSATPPASCTICEDERQYVAWDGQSWTTPETLAASRRIRFVEENGVTTLSLTPEFAIGQRAFLIPMGDAHLMWECVSLITPEAAAEVKARGGLSAIAVSHPHFYGAMADWAEAFDVPVYVHAADRAWVQQPSSRIVFWEGERLALADNLVLVRLAGHFPGSAGLWWADGPRAGGSLLPGDAIQIGMDRRGASFMYSYPNAIPLAPAAVRAMREAVRLLDFEDVFGFRHGRQIIGGGMAAVDASFARYLDAVRDTPAVA